jgi:HAD superfamily hydrolase (TIGR01549 family)
MIATTSTQNRRILKLTERAALLDLDGTLIDSNYQHAVAWYRAFRAHEIVPPLWRIHRHVGMGGDQLVSAITDEHVEQRLGDSLRAAEADEFAPLREECAPLAGAKELIAELKQRGSTVVLASSSGEDDLEFFLELLDVKDLVDGWTTKSDVAKSKPHPDLVRAAMGKAGTTDAVMIGDSRWDIEAAAGAGVPTLAVITGGWSKQELQENGAASVYESLDDLRADLDNTPLG